MTRIETTSKPQRERPIKVVDLFCGVGGLTYGFQQAALEVVAGYDVDPDCRFAFEHNNAVPFVEKDVAALSVAEVAERLNGQGFRVLAGCAPCQPFSTYSRTRRSSDERWALLKSFSELALGVLPDVVTMENVPQLTRHPVFEEFEGALRGRGYHVTSSVVDCANFGVPQTRKRLVLLASLHGQIALQSQPGTRRTVRDAIGHLEGLMAGGEDGRDPLHRACALSPQNLARVRASLPGHSWRDWQPSLRAACHLRTSGSTYPSVYGRMQWDAPGPTVTTQFFGFGNGRFGHPEQDRALSLREGALLQTFPRSYRFEASSSRLATNRVGRLIGNAVPPQLAKYIGIAIRRHLTAVARRDTAS